MAWQRKSEWYSKSKWKGRISRLHLRDDYANTVLCGIKNMNYLDKMVINSLKYNCGVHEIKTNITPDSKVPGANMGPTRALPAPGGPHVGPMNLAIWDAHANASQLIK